LCEILAERRIFTGQIVRLSGRRTLTKHRVLADGQLVVRFDEGTTDAISSVAERLLCASLEKHFEQVDAVVVSDYGYGVLTPRVVACIAELQKRSPRPLVVDAKSAAKYRGTQLTALKPNFSEIVAMLGGLTIPEGTPRWQAVAAQGERILELSGAEFVAVTLDCDGALIFSRDAAPYRTYSRPAPQSHATGAGDTYLSSLALALSAGASAPAAAELAAAAATVVVSKQHTATCSLQELLDQIADEGHAADSLSALAPLLTAYRQQGRRIVLTNGCFDILHRGHVAYLDRAKALGDILIVGVNSDGSIRRLKGPGRPINAAEDRLRVLASLRCIDHLILFEEDTPHRLIEAIRPDVFVKGGDYSLETLPEAELVQQLGGSVKILPLLTGRSTTRLISRMSDARGAAGRSAALTARGE
jgi:D-beta-D-heptose 7-phosphate kinase/D-beta-D-heptose 1-phosphate adenosyltransferase